MQDFILITGYGISLPTTPYIIQIFQSTYNRIVSLLNFFIKFLFDDPFIMWTIYD